jgi:hypothetical protein
MMHCRDAWWLISKIDRSHFAVSQGHALKLWLTMSPPLPRPGAVASFFRELRSSGAPVVRLSGAGKLDGCLRLMEAEAARDEGLAALLKEWHGEACEDLAGPALEFDEAAARRGTTMLFRAAWFYLHRDAAAAQMSALLEEPLPAPVTAAALFSADLTLRYLPEVHRLARTLAPGDPLLAALQAMAEAQPLSGAGIPPAEDGTRTPDAAAWSAMRAHPGLWRLFIDRVIHANARWWLAREDVRETVRHATGAFARELVPTFDLSNSPHAKTHEPAPA